VGFTATRHRQKSQEKDNLGGAAREEREEYLLSWETAKRKENEKTLSLQKNIGERKKKDLRLYQRGNGTVSRVKHQRLLTRLKEENLLNVSL